MRRPARLMVAAAMLAAAPAPAAETAVIPLWPEGVPGLRPDAGAELEEDTRVSNVHHPTLTHFPAPADRANGTADRKSVV